MKYRAIFKINGIEKALKTCDSFEEAKKCCFSHRENYSTVKSSIYREWKRGNVTTIDYGAHNAFYKIKEIEG